MSLPVRVGLDRFHCTCKFTTEKINLEDIINNLWFKSTDVIRDSDNPQVFFMLPAETNSSSLSADSNSSSLPIFSSKWPKLFC